MTLPRLSGHRPIVWGFFVCGVLLIALILLQLFWPAHLAENWGESRHVVARDQGEKITAMVDACIGRLLRTASTVESDTALLASLVSNQPPEISQGFSLLAARRHDANQSIEIFDPRGTLVGWVGPSTGCDVTSLPPNERKGSFVVTEHGSLRSYLSAGVWSARFPLAIVVSVPLEVNYPISSRFIDSESLLNDVRQELGTDVRLSTPADTLNLPEGYNRIQLKDLRGRSLATLFVPAGSAEGAAHAFRATVDPWIGLVGSVLFLGLVWLLDRRLREARVRRWRLPLPINPT